MNAVKKLQAERDEVEVMIRRGLAYHGADFYDHPIYTELLAKKQAVTDELMKPEPSRVTEKTFLSRW